MNTPAKFLFVMDPYEKLNLETETSLLLMQELIERGQGVYWLQQEDLSLVHDQPVGLVFPVTGVEPLQRGEPVWSNLNRFDAVLVRKDPPFDTGYLQLALILDHLDPGVAPHTTDAYSASLDEFKTALKQLKQVKLDADAQKVVVSYVEMLCNHLATNHDATFFRNKLSSALLALKDVLPHNIDSGRIEEMKPVVEHAQAAR